MSRFSSHQYKRHSHPISFLLHKPTQAKTTTTNLLQQPQEKMIEATKNLSTEAMSKILEGKNNEYSLLYFPFHGVVPALRAMLAMSDAKVTFTQPDVCHTFLTLYLYRISYFYFYPLYND